MPLVIGLMSGTSCDGVDVAISEISSSKIKLKHFKTFSYPKELQKIILNPSQLTLVEIASIHFDLGRFFGSCVKKMMNDLGFNAKYVFCIGSHGHTFFHDTSETSNKWTTLQLGEPSFITAQTGIPTVSDFRPMDMALGGHGAPLTPYFHWYFFKKKNNIAVHNLGGFSNVTLIPSGHNATSVRAFDTGPCNYILNLAMRWVTKGKKDFDENGNFSRKGTPQRKWVDQWLLHPYFQKKSPKSCSPEVLGKPFFNEMNLAFRNLSAENFLATLTQFIAESICISYQRFILSQCKIKEIVFCGGGSHNTKLMEILSSNFKKKNIHISYFDEYGINRDAVEAVSFSYIAYLCMKNKTNHLPLVTGAKRCAILGKITPRFNK